MGWVEPGEVDVLRARVGAALGPGPAPVVARAPGRVNLIGEHTDYNRGLCLPVALPHATYAAVRPGSTGLRLRSAQADEPWEGTLAAAAHADGWAAYVAGTLWALSEAGFDVPPLDLYVDSTVPLGAGLSSSAAVECAVATAVVGLSGEPIDDDVRAAVAAACIRAETDVAGAPTGGMDQSIALFAAADHALLLDFDDHSRHQVPLATDAAGLALLVVDTRVRHELTDGGYASRRTDCEVAASALGQTSLRAVGVADLDRLSDPRVRARARHVVTENARVSRTVQALRAGDWPTVGRMMDESHLSMRDDFEISCPELDSVVEAAQAHGALGARTTGGGFGGSAVALVPGDGVTDVVAAVTRAAERSGFPRPRALLATPSTGAGLV